MSTNIRIAIIVSRFNEPVTKVLLAGAQQHLQEHDVKQITTHWVPGAVEIPLIAQQLAKTQQYHAIICLGAVIRGETTHYDYVCQQVSYGCQRVALDEQIPVIFGILTTEDKKQALERLGGSHGHKGVDAAETALSMIDLMTTLTNE